MALQAELSPTPQDVSPPALVWGTALVAAMLLAVWWLRR
jgi:hypothetical protein